MEQSAVKYRLTQTVEILEMGSGAYRSKYPLLTGHDSIFESGKWYNP
jgi:hypothetical protein